MGWLADLLRGIANAIDPVPMKPVFTEYRLVGDEVGGLCAGAKDHVYVWDNTYWALSLEDWKIIFTDVLAELPAYESDKFDCEDFAFACMTRVTERYGVNTCGVAVGASPMGYHGYNLLVAYENGIFKLHTLEPQNGQIDPPGYVPDTVIFG